MKIPLAQQPPPPRLSRGARLVCLLALFSFAPLLSTHAAASRGKPVQQPIKPDATKRPVILLTGFEPFGDTRTAAVVTAGALPVGPVVIQHGLRPPNPSWEAIKGLDGREWKGYQLVCKQVPVVWGAPLEHLPGWIEKYQPVAIFSFGQGGPGHFALESRASNKRAKYPDNRGKRAPSRKIVEDGPKFFRATIDCEQLARLLAEKGYPARVSKKAGNYLCEEALYSLEYLKSTRGLSATVSFCHVPSLDSAVRGKRVTVDYVRQFVQDMLETWYAVYKGSPTAAPAARAGREKPKEDRAKETREIKEFIGRYFSTWSAQDIKGYDACFLPDASVQHVGSGGELTTYTRPQFIATQREFHRNSPVKATEVAEKVDIRFEEKLARVVVYWKLTGPRTDYGYDHFTLMKHEGNWRIVNLVFYSTPPAAKKKAD
jgi:pyroglutamyl-peptidase